MVEKARLRFSKRCVRGHEADRMVRNFIRTERARMPCLSIYFATHFSASSKIRDVSFQGSDLSKSTANWNDFINVDFSAADLSPL